MTKYVGVPESTDYPHVGAVFVVDKTGQHSLAPRYDLHNHSPTGFAWGYGGSGPAQLALAILAHATGNDDVAQRRYQDFKFEKIATLPRGSWEISAADVREWIELQSLASTASTLARTKP